MFLMCSDKYVFCKYWFNWGDCYNKVFYMILNCLLVCNICYKGICDLFGKILFYLIGIIFDVVCGEIWFVLYFKIFCILCLILKMKIYVCCIVKLELKFLFWKIWIVGVGLIIMWSKYGICVEGGKIIIVLFGFYF